VTQVHLFQGGQGREGAGVEAGDVVVGNVERGE